MIVTEASTAIDLAALGHLDVVLPPELILRDKTGGSVGLTIVSQQQQPQLQMSSQTYANYALGPSR